MNKAMELPVLDMHGDPVATLAVSDYIFGVPMNNAVVHQAMLRQLANARQGTHSVKTRANVSGGGAKPWRQKGTGRARQGSIRSPQWRGGGVVFGPHPRSYRQRMPKKMRRLAIRCLLSDKVRGEQLAVLQELQLPEAKTREMKQFLDGLNAVSSTLIVTPEATKSVVASARNLPQVKTLPAANLNVLDLMNHNKIIMTVAAIRKAEELWDPDGSPRDTLPLPQPEPEERRPTGSAPSPKVPKRTAASKKPGPTSPTPSPKVPKRTAASKKPGPTSSTPSPKVPRKREG